LKLKSLAVITLLVLGCSAAFGQVYSFGFLSYTGGLQYCDYEVLELSTPFIAGEHNLTTDCGLPVNGVMIGTKGTIPKATGLPVTGAVYTLADNTFDAESEAYTGAQLYWITQLKAEHGKSPKFGWEFLEDFGSGFYAYLGNYGYLTTTLGAKGNAGTKKTSIGKAGSELKSKSNIAKR